MTRYHHGIVQCHVRIQVPVATEPHPPQILCDEPTFLRAKYQASFIALEPLPVKGKAAKVRVCGVGAQG